MRLLYLFIDIGALLIPFIFSFHPAIRFYRFSKAIILSILLPMVIFLPWDYLFTSWHYWGFNERYVSGVSFLGLPVEEILFFVCIPYACLFTYYCLNIFIRPPSGNNRNLVHFILAILYLGIGLVFLKKAYTASTFILLAIFQLIMIFFFRGGLLRFYLIYLILLVPFFIVNGLLTGTGISEEVVWYNNEENLGLRLLTIPVEDIFYGMLLVMMNAFIFEFFTKKKPAPSAYSTHS